MSEFAWTDSDKKLFAVLTEASNLKSSAVKKTLAMRAVELHRQCMRIDATFKTDADSKTQTQTSIAYIKCLDALGVIEHIKEEESLL